MKIIDFLLSLSDALDLAGPALSSHQLRTAFIAWKLAEAAQFPSSVIEQIFIAALLHDIGALSPEEKLGLHESTYEGNLESHCIYGENVLKRVPIFEHASRIVRHHHTKWPDLAQSHEAGPALQSQVLFVSDTVERAINRKKYILHQDEEIISDIESLSETEICPELIDVFRSIASREEFWLTLTSPKLATIISEVVPFDNLLIYQSSFLSISELVRDIIDFRSPFTASHSSGVSAAASAMAGYLGHSEPEVELIRIAGNLHDLGKMAVPNRILDKPDRLNKSEFAIIRQHPYHTYSVLKRCGFSHQIAEWAGFHHEKLDGSGYPFHLDAGRIDLGSRIVAIADIFIALTEDRPYRKRMKKLEVLSVMENMCDNGLIDGHVVNVLRKNYDDIREIIITGQDNSKNNFEKGLSPAAD
ncbi:MAG: HD domain-containing protein [Deltaproteobacteria bacterium]|nr:HD domain-containing protein [Deltaproteobacteria bacterium]